jgi:hypothetical protein
MSVAFSPDGKTLTAGFHVGVGGGGGVVLWDVATRKRLADEPLPVTEGAVMSVAFSPDGKTLTAGFHVGVGGGGGVVLWDVAAPKRLADEPLPVTEGAVMSVAFSPDGKTLAAGLFRAFGVAGGGGGVMLWDVAARRRLADEPLRVKERSVGNVAFSPDGKTLAAGFFGVGVVLWDVDLQSWQRLAGQIANRNLTREEFHEYFPEEHEYRKTFPDLPMPPAGGRYSVERPAGTGGGGRLGIPRALIRPELRRPPFLLPTAAVPTRATGRLGRVADPLASPASEPIPARRQVQEPRVGAA